MLAADASRAPGAVAYDVKPERRAGLDGTKEFRVQRDHKLGASLILLDGERAG